MATRYCGPGGNDGADGLSYANRKLTLNGLEDTPVEAGDVCYIAPGTYREQLTVDVSGTSGNIITYIADVTGEHTDGVGGVVRVTGSNDDIVKTRDYGVYAINDKDYRTFRGFMFDGNGNYGIWLYNGCSQWIIEDCTFTANVNSGINIYSATPTDITIRRCAFISNQYGVYITADSDTAASNVVVENCLLIGGNVLIKLNNVDSATVKNCTLIGAYLGVQTSSLASSTTVTVTNCIVAGFNTGLYAGASGEITEDYNCISACSTTTNNCTSGGHSNVHFPYPALPLLLAGYVFPASPLGALAPWSQVKAIAGTSEAADDLYGVTRPTTSAKKSWGAVQYQPVEREATTTHDTSAASLEITNEGRAQ